MYTLNVYRNKEDKKPISSTIFDDLKDAQQEAQEKRDLGYFTWININ